MDSNQKIPKHYDNEYFAWQKIIGEFGGVANKFKFANDVKPDFTILDFGCGGGYLLNKLECKKKVGIEPNTVARDQAIKNGVSRVYPNVKECLKDYRQKIDLVISNHALEHTTSPLEELKLLRELMKDGGKIHFVVPCEHISYSYSPKKDKNYHLYSWSPMNLGNLFNEAGFEVIYSKPLIHKWPPFYKKISKLGPFVFHLICRIYARLARNWFQVEVLAVKKK